MGEYSSYVLRQFREIDKQINEEKKEERRIKRAENKARKLEEIRNRPVAMVVEPVTLPAPVIEEKKEKKVSKRKKYKKRKKVKMVELNARKLRHYVLKRDECLAVRK